MENNRNNVIKFVLLCLSSDRNLQIFCFGLFLSYYIVILLGNFFIFITIKWRPLFKQPMYFFFCHLSFMDVCYTTTVTPKLIFILMGMAYDRYVAICKPLHYMVIMNEQRYDTVVAVCWGGAFLTYVTGFLVLTSSGTIALVTFAVLVFSYVTVLATQTFPEDKVFALFYTIIAPIFNPLIHTLRNGEIKTAMRKMDPSPPDAAARAGDLPPSPSSLLSGSYDPRLGSWPSPSQTSATPPEDTET
ncbi:olfactory receptor 4P4-like [Tachyglossus aculeatus]|uniref:olfactory receptor 4P4-like n=1 Tax=Tachyglossus aculeatus TaxID=9261 RepID=UPI0018F61573|nr:olfactory receptor 4P4-like [Tachyglossus aculeatus]